MCVIIHFCCLTENTCYGYISANTPLRFCKQWCFHYCTSDMCLVYIMNINQRVESPQKCEMIDRNPYQSAKCLNDLSLTCHFVCSVIKNICIYANVNLKEVKWIMNDYNILNVQFPKVEILRPVGFPSNNIYISNWRIWEIVPTSITIFWVSFKFEISDF